MLDDAQLRTLEERLGYLREMEERRTAILGSIREQGKLDDALEAQIMAADSKARLEDIYLPYKPKRRTKAQIAREAGLEPLALSAAHRSDARCPTRLRRRFVDAEKGVADAGAALEGARAILVERFAEDADLIGNLREEMWGRGRLAAKVKEEQAGRGREILRLFRHDRAACRKCPRTASWRCSAARRKACSTSISSRRTRRRRLPAGRACTSSASRASSTSWTAAGLPTNGSTIRCAGPGGRACRGISRSICACGCGRRRRTRPCACSPAICAICCWPRRPEPAQPWASIRASAPA